jgi:hypothetical protein
MTSTSIIVTSSARPESELPKQKGDSKAEKVGSRAHVSPLDKQQHHMNTFPWDGPANMIGSTSAPRESRSKRP